MYRDSDFGKAYIIQTKESQRQGPEEDLKEELTV